MNAFRHLILSVIGTLEMLFVIAVTLALGFLGGGLFSMAGGGWALIGFVLFGSAGFCLSALIVNMSMCLGEIAANTYHLRPK
jgi:hypothetical protein